MGNTSEPPKILKETLATLDDVAALERQNAIAQGGIALLVVLVGVLVWRWWHRAK